MSDEFEHKIETKADTIADAGSVTSGSTACLLYTSPSPRD